MLTKKKCRCQNHQLIRLHSAGDKRVCPTVHMFFARCASCKETRKFFSDKTCPWCLGKMIRKKVYQEQWGYECSSCGMCQYDKK